MSAIRPTTYQVQVKIFEAAGCRYIRTHGDHLIYAYPGAIRPVVIPKYQEESFAQLLFSHSGENRNPGST